MYAKFVMQINNEVMQDCIIRLSDKAHISVDETHPDFQQYVAWLEEGNTPEEWNPETGDDN